MKFAINGALTIGTLDGTNIEIRNQVGAENFFLFGLSAKEVSALQASGYQPREFYEKNGELREIIDAIAAGSFSRSDRAMFRPLVDSLLNSDPFLVLADYQSYVDCQARVSRAYRDQKEWTRMSIVNVARMGTFSSDRAIREYDEKIGGAEFPVGLGEQLPIIRGLLFVKTSSPLSCTGNGRGSTKSRSGNL